MKILVSEVLGGLLLLFFFSYRLMLFCLYFVIIDLVLNQLI